MVTVRRLHLHIIYLRTHTKGGVGRERPRRRRPGDDKTAVLHLKASCASEIFDVAIATGLVELVRTEPRAGSRRVRLNRVALIEIPLLVELFEQIPKGLDVLVVVSDIGVIEIHPVTHLLGEVGPLLGVFHHLAAAGSVVLID